MTCMFNNPLDMVELAQKVQTEVYWNGRFYLGDEEIKWRDFWDTVYSEIENKGATGVVVKYTRCQDVVEFIYGGK